MYPPCCTSLIFLCFPPSGQISINYEDEGRSLSSETRALVEDEVKSLLSAAYARATAVLKQHEKELHALAQVRRGAADGARLRRWWQQQRGGGQEGLGPWQTATCVQRHACSTAPSAVACVPVPCVQELVDKETLTGAQIRELLTRVNGKGGRAAPAS